MFIAQGFTVACGGEFLVNIDGDPFQVTLQETYDLLLTKEGKKAQQQLSTVTANLTRIVAGWDTEKQELQSIEQELDGVSSVNTTIMATPEQDDYEIYEEYAKVYDAYVASSANGDATRVKNNTNSILKKYGIVTADRRMKCRIACGLHIENYK